MNFWQFVLFFCILSLSCAANDQPVDRDIRAARIALDTDHFDEATRSAEKAIADDPKRAEAWIVLGHSLSGQVDRGSVFKKIATAQRIFSSYKKALELSPDNIEAHESILEYYRQAPAIVGGSLEHAEQEATILSHLDPPRGQSWKVRLALQENRNTDALQLSVTLARMEPNSYRTHLWVGAACSRDSSLTEKAIAELKLALSLTPTPDDPDPDEAELWLARAYKTSGDTKDAREACQAALRVNPKNEEAKAELESISKN